MTETPSETRSQQRPGWATLGGAFCVTALLWTVPRDLFLPEIRDVEVWFGFELRGTAALATAPLHWLIFAVGAWAFWTRQPWILPAAAAYVFYVALSHLVWSEASPNGRGWPVGLLQAIAISLFGFWFLWLRSRERTPPPGG